MSPIAFSLSSGSEFKSGLAWALIGGLLSSLLLTLVLVPVVYSKVDEWRVALTHLRVPVFAGKPAGAPEAQGAAGAGSAAPVQPPGRTRKSGEREAPPLSVGAH